VLAVIPPSIRDIPNRWRAEAAQRRRRTPGDQVAEAMETSAKELESEIAAAELASRMLTATEYASVRKVAVATVRKWCAKGELAGAVQDDAGEWSIPSSSLRIRKKKVVEAPVDGQ
jgi:hypothetical protein